MAIPERGSLTTFTLRSPALAGRALQVFVYLPAHYASSSRRYPVVYLLHGTPGDPKTAYVNSLHVAPRMDALVVSHQAQPMIIVMPPGSPSTYSRATEWANGPGRGQAWFTYLTRDLVAAVDARYRTMARGVSRGIGGYSSGADAALNAAILNPGEYGVVEGWSGDYHQTPSTVGHVAALVQRFSAIHTAARGAPALARVGTHVYLYVGRADPVLPASRTVANALRAGGVSVLFDLTPSGHAWMLWASRFDGALRYFSAHLAG